MNYPMVFKSRSTLNWLAVYSPGQYDSYPTWREALDHVLTIQRIRHVLPKDPS